MAFARYRTGSGRRVRARLHGPLGPFRKQRVRSTILRLAAVVLALGLVIGYGVTAYAQSVFDGLPVISGMDPSQWAGSTRIFDQNGTLLASVGPKEGDNLIAVHLDQISPKVVQATVATEDRTFWTNSGFDPQGIARAVLGYLRHRSVVGGGSTITQQLAKQMWLTPQQTLSRKIEELALAYKLNQTYSKQQILEAYLNKDPYGEQLYGIQAAALTYFGKPAKDLDLAQASLLAGIPNNPVALDPVVHFDQAKARQQVVLSSMVRAGYIKQVDADAAYKESLQVSPPHNDYKAPQFVQYVIQELANLGYTAGQQQLDVKTTINWAQQQQAESIVASNLASVQGHAEPGGKLSSAMIAIDPKTGFIKNYVGSINTDFDFLAGISYDQGGRYVNPGSSVKPFTYGAAIAHRVLTMDTNILDGPTPYPIPREPQSVENFDRTSHGNVLARKALAGSLNIPAVKVELATGIPNVVDFMRSIGLYPLDPSGKADAPAADYRAALTLGGAPVRLIDEAAAYATYADMGVYHQPEAILQITKPDGTAVYKANPDATAQQVIDAGVAFIIGSIISNDSNRSLAFRPGGPLNLPGRHAAAKTGTTENFTDGLTAGFTPQLASVFWVGDITGRHHMNGSSDGVVVAAPAWNKFMTEALQGVPDTWYQMPKDVVEKAGSYFLSDATKIDHMASDTLASPSPSPTAGNGGLTGNPAAGPQPVGDPNPGGRGHHQICPPNCTSPTPSPSPTGLFGG